MSKNTPAAFVQENSTHIHELYGLPLVNPLELACTGSSQKLTTLLSVLQATDYTIEGFMGTLGRSFPWAGINQYTSIKEAEAVLKSLAGIEQPWVIQDIPAKVTHLYGRRLRNPWPLLPGFSVSAIDSIFSLYLMLRNDVEEILTEVNLIWGPTATEGLHERGDTLTVMLELDRRLHEIMRADTKPAPACSEASGYKQDAGKPDYTLLMHDMAPAVRKVVECLHWGHHTKGYPRNGYKTLPGGTDRLIAACYRHLAAMSEDFNALDEESGQPHVVHAVTNLLMAMSKEV